MAMIYILPHRAVYEGSLIIIARNQTSRGTHGLLISAPLEICSNRIHRLRRFEVQIMGYKKGAWRLYSGDVSKKLTPLYNIAEDVPYSLQLRRWTGRPPTELKPTKTARRI